jgi:hypothetical protein
MRAYRILRDNGEAMYVTPYLGEGKVDATEAVTIQSDAPLSPMEKDKASIALFADIDWSVETWIMEKRYVPRLLLTAGVFLLVYFFGALAVRDPIPMVDELVVSLVVSILFWRFLSRRDVASALARKEKNELKEKASSATVVIDSTLIVVENFLTTLGGMDHDDLADAIIQGKLRFSWPEPELKPLMIAYASVHQKETYDWLERLGGKLRKPELQAIHLSDAILGKKVDGPLLGLLVAIPATETKLGRIPS